MRKEALATGEVYHVFTKSIAGFKVFITQNDFERMERLLGHYQPVQPSVRLSWRPRFRSEKKARPGSASPRSPACPNTAGPDEKKVQLIAYCLMQTHFHLLIRQREANGISTFMNHLLIAYTRYFNTKLKRKGPLWESRFQSRHIATTEDVLHMTRYIHLNPVTAWLVEKADAWSFSSYPEYLGTAKKGEGLCEFQDVVDLAPADYKKFVSDRAAYQRELARFKKNSPDDPDIP